MSTPLSTTKTALEGTRASASKQATKDASRQTSKVASRGANKPAHARGKAGVHGVNVAAQGGRSARRPATSQVGSRSRATEQGTSTSRHASANSCRAHSFQEKPETILLCGFIVTVSEGCLLHLVRHGKTPFGECLSAGPPVRRFAGLPPGLQACWPSELGSLLASAFACVRLSAC